MGVKGAVLAAKLLAPKLIMAMVAFNFSHVCMREKVVLFLDTAATYTTSVGCHNVYVYVTLG